MITLTMRPYAGEADLEAIAQLINSCEAVDKLDEGISVSELRQEFKAPSLDKARDLCLWENSDGKLIGFGRMWIPPDGEIIEGYIGFHVHPSDRGVYLEKQIVAWGEERMREVSKERCMSVKLRSSAREDQAERIAFLESCGFTADRYFFTMRRSLDEPIPQPQFPAGFTIRQVEVEQDAEAWVEMFNQSFIDHWNHHPLTVEMLKYYLSDRDYKPELNLIAIAPDGTFAAFCHSRIYTEENARSDRKEGWIAVLGTRRGFRKIGLGRAMLLSGMHRLKAAGVETAKLGVDAQNPSGALRLYESVGYATLHTRIFYVKDV
ncbi:GNAT family N-acetyltransferase [Coleofasciculus sp. FACHB-712]|uniref:GNAT family N-acetyltransferase n=1 Tax=Coleofasciculus sp. FACHB-712 TaxID=2692789 RepID=UPI001687DCB0|nr:GNAT family N-acetyltransferase [Coleofasciculus sp. FACHB-712]MBD1942448.1 GNAT family N-acetyltransferase [Coleofasciculus sp. FACHB-712]